MVEHDESLLQAVVEVGGGEAPPLDLKEDHLTDELPAPLYRKASRGDGLSVDGWYLPENLPFTPSDDGNVVLKVQSFKPGGFELTLRKLNLPKLARMIDAPRKRGKREAPETINADVQRKNAFRAKRKLRLSVKNIGADRLFTLTRRETLETGFWSEQDWKDAWDRFRRGCIKMGIDLAYVGVLERHKKGNFHLHMAITGWINIKHARGLWWAICGGRGAGNVDVSYKGYMGASRLDKSARIARYISKYVTKTFEDGSSHEFNKKRYWASRHDMPEARRIILQGETVVGSWVQVLEMFGLDPLAVAADREAMFCSGSGDDELIWYSFRECHATPPPF